MLKFARTLIITIVLFYTMHVVSGQQAYRDSLKNLLASATNDTTKKICLINLFYEYLYRYPDSALPYVQQEILLAEKNRSDFDLAKAYFDYGSFFEIIGDFPQALRYIQEASKLTEKYKNWLIKARAYYEIGAVYSNEGDYDNALSSFKKAKSTIEQNWEPYFEKDRYTGGDFTGDTIVIYNFILEALAEIYEKRNQLDSALKYVQILNDQTILLKGKMDWSIIPYYYGNIFRKEKDYASAIKYYHWGMALAGEQDVNNDIMKNGTGLAKTFRQLGKFDSSIFYANRVIEVSRFGYNPLIKLEALNLLADIYKSQNKTDSVAKYFELIVATKDSLFGQNKNIQLQRMRFDEQLRQQKEAQQQQALQNKIKYSLLLTALFVFLVIGFLLYRNNRHKQKANVLLINEKQKVETTLSELKSTQAQLIQSEKMASLGELTAGIAHEIQNPLNFVNNFSEVNTELIDELKNELNTGNNEQAIAIANDIKDNEEKINHHGKRADAIVKGMLQHSKVSTGQKEPTDINKLADEYLRLSYHGLRGKDKTFNATLKTDFDESIGKINIVPQDIGRVLLNLYNNAFYAVTEKKKQQGEGNEPTVSVSTKSVKLPSGGLGVLISVKDNGNGIPQKVIDKIFQPFFTTKPTGQGTGLGLSLSYDVIKAHGGEITVNTKDNNGACFVITLPI